MHMMDTGRNGDMMAAWRATGGAIEAMGRSGDRAVGDDGLQAMTPTDFNVCYVDDGLTATAFSGRPFGCADDGLQATAPTNFAPGYGCADDGLAATMRSSVAACFADDGLTATAFSGRPFGCADDGLAASVSTFQRPWCIAD